MISETDILCAYPSLSVTSQYTKGTQTFYNNSAVITADNNSSFHHGVHNIRSKLIHMGVIQNGSTGNSAKRSISSVFTIC